MTRAARARLGFASALAVCGVLLLVAASRSTAAEVATYALLASLGHAVLFVRAAPITARAMRRLGLVVALSTGGSLVFGAPLLSDDVYRYVWDGRVSAHAISPYAHAPSSPTVAHLRDTDWARINHPEIATIYPPLSQLGFVVASPLGVRGPKLIAFLAHIAIVLVLARKRGRTAARASFLYATCPVALVESAMSGHVDVFVGLFLLAAAYALEVHRIARAVAFALLAAGTKLVGVVAAPLLVRRAPLAALVLLVGTGLFVVPLVGAGGEERAGILHFSRRWSGNVLVFPMLERSTAAFLQASFGTTHGRMRLPLEATLAPYIEGTPFDVRETLLGPKKVAAREGDVHTRTASRVVARALTALIWLAFVMYRVRRATGPVDTLRDVIRATLVLAPQIHPWYVLWLLPLEAATARVAGFVFAAGLVATYAPLTGWASDRVWDDPTLAIALAHVAFVVAVAMERRGVSAAVRDRVRAESSAPR